MRAESNGNGYSAHHDTRGMLVAAALGAATMYFLDPQRGNRRRKLARDKLVRGTHTVGEFAGTAARDARNRARGVAAEAKHRIRPDNADDRVIEERVRAELGRVTSHPSSLEVTACDGTVCLSGPILTEEHDRVIDTVRHVRGVECVEDQLVVSDRASGIPALQGDGAAEGKRFALAQDNWSPTARLVTGITGAALATYGARERGIVGGLVGAAGAALLARSVVNKDLHGLVS